jgi:hypothetical protein
MSRLITRTMGASVGLAAVLAWSPQAHAQEQAEEAPATEVAQPAAEAPAVRIAASETYAAKPARKESPPNHARAGASLMLTGLLTFGASYAPAAYVANESSLSLDRKLTVPFAGPWMDLLSRPGCGPTGSCGGETAYEALLMFDGFFQVLSGIEVLAGLVEMSQDDSPSKRTPKAEALRVTPSSMGAGGYGLAAFGKF